MKQRKQGAGPGGREVLRDRVHDNQIERVLRQPRDLVRGNDADLRMAGKALFQSGAQARRRFAQQQFAGGLGDEIGVQRLARAVIEHARLAGGDQRGDRLRDQPIVHVLMAGIGVKEMPAVPEREPIGDHAPRTIGVDTVEPGTGYWFAAQPRPKSRIIPTNCANR